MLRAWPPASGERPEGARRFVDVEVGSSQSCARRADGTVACWGEQGYAVDLPGVRGAIAIALVGPSLCAANPSGEVTCHAEGATTSVPGLRGARALSSRALDLCGEVGGDTVCVDLGSGKERARYPKARRLAYESNEGAHCLVEGAGDLRCGRKLAGLGGRTFRRTTDVAVSSVHACAIDGGALHCFRAEGRGGDVLLGDGRGARESPEVVAVPIPDPVQVVATGGYGPVTCVRSRDGRVSCWGSQPELLGSRRSGSNVPSQVPDLEAVDLAAGGRTICAATTAGDVECLGFARPTVDTLVPGLRGAVELTASGDATCARSADGVVRCWGAFQPAEGIRAIAPTAIEAARGLGGLEMIGEQTLCGTSDAGARCVGEPLAWMQAPPGARVVAGEGACLVVGGRLTCRWGEIVGLRGAERFAIGGDDLYCGAFGAEVRCVRARTVCERDPCRHEEAPPFVAWTAPSGIRAIHASTVHDEEGRHQVLCVVDGSGRPGCVRLRRTGGAPAPLVMAGGFPVVVRALVQRGDRVCGLTDQGFTCAPLGDRGLVQGFRGDVQSVALGSAHGCALLRDGRVTCWGSNDGGQRGLGARWRVGTGASP